MIPIVHHPAYVSTAHANSPTQLSKNGLLRDLLRAEGARLAWFEPEPMPRAWLDAVHDPEYVAEVLAARVPAEKERRIGFPVTAAVADRSRHVVGGTWLAGRLALEHGYAANTAGGSHHALAGTGSGYCVLNDLAVAAVRLVEEGAVERLLVVDCDVHQGDGTASLCAGRTGIATYSIHAEKNFPARKARSTLDVALPDKTGDAAYLRALEETLAPLLDSVRPQLILYQAGVDPFGGDRLGRLALTQGGLIAREILVARLAIQRGIPLASTVGGGYGADTAAIAARHATAILTLGGAYAARAS
ncbi:histone deacetylase [Sphingomonas sp. NFR15]|uniref:histone deacetylase family protein n=1 Tax=Sphingomonas sp. NFR15 TaxID=1566282 RepID=UPI0008924DF4|nr:histone deacetylase [Sphingomonas sp. NFR15]SDA29262.1 Acetoin utilization deacetylase AcuC [Sphingomonas sp. NFR15]